MSTCRTLKSTTLTTHAISSGHRDSADRSHGFGAFVGQGIDGPGQRFGGFDAFAAAFQEQHSHPAFRERLRQRTSRRSGSVKLYKTKTSKCQTTCTNAQPVPELGRKVRSCQFTQKTASFALALSPTYSSLSSLPYPTTITS